MFAARVNYGIERATIVAVCLWGNWAIYYWVAVLGFDASYITLKAYCPILLLQMAASLFYLLRTELGFSSASHRTCALAIRSPRQRSVRTFVALSVITFLVAVGAILAADHYQWTRSALSYNVLWALLLPFSLAYFFYFAALKDDSLAPAAEGYFPADTLDCLLFCCGVIVFAITAYSSGILSWDDAFYGHVMSSTLANPGLPVQGQDLLLNTSAPYSLHPSYRGVGYEVLIALLSEVLGQPPLHLYLNVFPVIAAVQWSFAAYLFMRVMRIPYPGVAVVSSFLLLLIWGSKQGYAPSALLISLWWGKIQVIQMVFPLLFFAVAAYIQQQTFRTWLLLLLCVCTVAIRSSTALFVVPLAVCMAIIVFLPSIRNNLRTLITTFLALTPIVLLLGYGLLLLRIAPIAAADDYAGQIMARGQEFGGLPAKSAVLVILLCLPLMARTIRDVQFQTNMYRLCMLGIFTVMAPLVIEAIAAVTGLGLLSRRLPASYPAVLLIGVMVSIAVVHLRSRQSTRSTRGRRFVVPLLALMLIGALLAAIERKYVYDWFIQSRALSESALSEAEDVRALIVDDAYVAAGHLDFFLPILPNPPAFVGVRYYLNFHKHFLSDEEFSDREYLYTVLSKRLPMEGDSVDATCDRIVSTSDKLGVTTLIFQVQPDWKESVSDAAKAKLTTALTTRLMQSGYDCATTPSEETRVCNRQSMKKIIPVPQ